MRRQLMRSLVIACVASATVAMFVPAANAHEHHQAGDLEMTVGFGTEPAYAGQPNSVQIILVHDGEPVADLGGTLGVEVGFGEEEPVTLELEPAFGEPGDYRAWFIPTRPGQYTFHFEGTVDGEDIDETFTSGPRTFSDALSTSDIQYPIEDPTTGELAELIGRVEPRLTDAIGDARSEAFARAEEASDDAASARTFGTIGVVVGGLGLAAAVAAIALSRRRAA